MTEQRVTVEIAGGVADVRLNRPEKRNALDGAMFAGLVAAGERLKSEPAVRAVGLATRVDPDPRRAALDLARSIAGRSPDAVRAAKRLLDLAGRVDLETGFAAEQQEIGALIGRPNQAEAVAAEFEKRPPRFADPS